MEKAEATPEKPKRRTAAKSAAGAEPKKTTRAKKSPAFSPEARHQMIADAAYFRAEKLGSSGEGDDLAHWFAAEAEIDAMLKPRKASS